MTRDETKKILMVVQAAYPNFNPPDRTVTINTWHRFLEDYTYSQVDAAICTYIRSDTSGFPPDIGKVIDRLQMLFCPDGPNEMEAWRLVYKAICNSYYHAEEEFEKLPGAVQKAVVSPGQLREWSQMRVDVINSVIQSHFVRSYRAEAEREMELQKLSPDLLKLALKTAKWIEPTKERHKELPVPEERKLAKQNAMPLSGKLKEAYEKLKTELRGRF